MLLFFILFFPFSQFSQRSINLFFIFIFFKDEFGQIICMLQLLLLFLFLRQKILKCFKYEFNLRHFLSVEVVCDNFVQKLLNFSIVFSLNCTFHLLKKLLFTIFIFYILLSHPCNFLSATIFLFSSINLIKFVMKFNVSQLSLF